MNPHKIRGVDQLSGSDVIFGRDKINFAQALQGHITVSGLKHFGFAIM